MKAVDIKARHDWIFVRCRRLLFYDRSQDRYLDWSKPDLLCLFQSFRCPESVIFTLHATYKFIRGYIPINLIGIRNEEGIDRFRGKT